MLATCESLEVRIPAEATLDGTLTVPLDAAGVVLFAHGAGSSRHSPRNRHVAQALNEAGFATLLMDLLTPSEEQVDRRIGHLRYDVEMLARRLCSAADWLARERATRSLPLGIFGAATGGAAALVAAVERPALVRSVVARGGRVDTAGAALPRVHAPTLLIVGGDDRNVLALNELALRRLGSHDARLEVIPGAGHLFREPGALDAVAEAATSWFGATLTPACEFAASW
jgi:dienelactone hydrolase